MTDHDPGQGGRPRGPRDDVAAELAALRRLCGETDDITRESAALLSELAPKVIDIEAQLGALDAGGNTAVKPEDPAVTAVKAELGMRPVPPAPWCWPLFDRDQAAAAWDALARWVGDVLVPGYELTRGDLPDCWAQHPRMVNELTWLRAAYLESHQPGAAAGQAQDWHLRGLPGALSGLRTAVPVKSGGGSRQRPLCGPGHHQGCAGVHDDEDEEHRQEPAAAAHWRGHWFEAMTKDLQGRRPVPDGL